MKQPIEIRLPKLIAPQQPVGLGDAIKRVTVAVGVKPCLPCQKRAEILNGKLIFR